MNTNINTIRRPGVEDLRIANSVRGTYLKFPFEIVQWSLKSLGDCWNYYVIIPERLIGTEKFENIWLVDKVSKLFPSSPERVSHDYCGCATLANAYWHGGITYYEKVGQVVGHRAVKVGCDFQHIWDVEHGPYDTQEVLDECLKTITDFVRIFGLETPPTSTVPSPSPAIDP